MAEQWLNQQSFKMLDGQKRLHAVEDSRNTMLLETS